MSAVASFACLGACVADTVGLGVLQRVTVEPQRIDFDGPGVPCGPYTQPITIANGSDVPVTLTSVRVEGAPTSPFTLSEVLPETVIAARKALSFDVTFAETVDGLYTDRVIIEGRLADMRFVRYVVVRGLIASNGRHEDDFRQSETGDADILFVVDNSCSMLGEQELLKRNLRSFIEIADSGLLDYHIAVTTTDVSSGDISTEGRFVPLDDRNLRIITRQSLPSPLEHFARNAQVGVDGSGEERGIHASYLALTPELLESHNGNFVREHALLSVVFISDEEDQSPDMLDFYERHLSSVKGDDRSRVTVSAIVGDTPGGCSGPNGMAIAAYRYAAFADRFGGVVESICTTDWATALAKISAVAFGLKASFPLSARAIPSEIEVSVDGQPVPRTDELGRIFWRYVSRTNAVVFEPRGIPGPGASVHIEYGTACDD